MWLILLLGLVFAASKSINETSSNRKTKGNGNRKVLRLRLALSAQDDNVCGPTQRYDGTGTLSTISRMMRSACSELLSVEE